MAAGRAHNCSTTGSGTVGPKEFAEAAGGGGSPGTLEASIVRMWALNLKLFLDLEGLMEPYKPPMLPASGALKRTGACRKR